MPTSKVIPFQPAPEAPKRHNKNFCRKLDALVEEMVFHNLERANNVRDGKEERPYSTDGNWSEKILHELRHTHDISIVTTVSEPGQEKAYAVQMQHLDSHQWVLAESDSLAYAITIAALQYFNYCPSVQAVICSRGDQ